MTEQSLPTFAELQEALNDTTLKLHPSQVHGIICGILCGNPHNIATWEELVTGSKEPGKSHEFLTALYNVTAKELNDFLLDFQLLVPDDEEELPSRAEALTLWSQGFLTGLKFAHVKLINREPSEATEAINDIIEIAKMNYEYVVASEEDEAAYVELIEYVRMAVILIYQDLREAEQAASTVKSSNHLH